ncbi:MAG TPA: VWA-like domain-containing protein [Puia sp.]|uniref:vWA domain-containing protein n=1 Tax=Puia sp. TaxID=2045100 RepID=UPI002BF9D65A|nr:VWA-like domain-containing protein [Puia sp.]HVU97730.1 VWA-like domain-containing protein [Puia sp.]
MDVIEKLTKAKVLLIIHQPFYASLVLPLPIVADASVETAYTDGTKIGYNPSFLDELSTEEVAGLLAHEVMHIAQLHHLRMKDRDADRWNEACDYAINPLLLQSGLRLPPDPLVDKRYNNMAAEQIYTLLPPPPPNQQRATGMGEIRPPSAAEEPGQQEDRIKQAVAQAMLAQRLKGKVPEHLNRLVQELLRPKVNWREALARYLTELTRNDYSWKRPSPRYLYLKVFLPVLESLSTGKLILIVDTSGSIDDEILRQFAGELQQICDTFSIGVQVLYVDCIFQGMQEIEPGDTIRLEAQGGGGTDFRPGFLFIEEQDLQPRAVLYLTDGICDLFPEEPDYPVLWVQFGDFLFEPPFGDRLRIA